MAAEISSVRQEIKTFEEQMHAGFDTLTQAVESTHDVLDNHEKCITFLESSPA